MCNTKFVLAIQFINSFNNSAFCRTVAGGPGFIAIQYTVHKFPVKYARIDSARVLM